jgi:hypothetical protein
MCVGGVCYPLPPLGLRTDERGYGSLLPTPSAKSYGTNQGGAMGRVGPVRPSLETMARRGIWPTPQAFDATGITGNLWERKTKGGCSNLKDVVGGKLNPTWVEWLMGWPLGWTDCEPSETARFRQWFEQFGRR